MDMLIRQMQPGDVWAMRKLARKSFGFPEGLFMLFIRPKTALVAVVDEKIVGGFIYKISHNGGKKMGFVSLFFSDPDFHGHGIGKRMAEEGIRHLWDVEGCDALVTYVRDDNVASWSAFERQGFVNASFPAVTKLVGAFGMAKLYVEMAYAFSIGHDFYIALPDEATTRQYEKKRNSGVQLAAYLVIQLLLALPFFLASNAPIALLKGLSVLLLGGVLAGYVGTLFSRRAWHFRLTTGGAFLCLILGGVNRWFIPIIASWYPDQYENTPRFRRDLAVVSIAGWLFLLSFAALRFFIPNPALFLVYASIFASVLLIFRCVPASIGALGGERVFNWSKVVWAFQTASSILVVFVL
ncbi:MAG: GNAT family N-acetyltransferase [Oscillospiraceae bacterium]|nr:GNAT family N-acetyltransferase [Oscillospiraceae bacterium]